MGFAAVALGRAQAALARGEAEAAVRLARRALARRPAWRQAGLWLAASLGEAGELDEALAVLEGAAARREPDSVHRLFEGRLLLDHGRYEPALLAFEAGLALDARNLHLPGYRALARWALEGGAPAEVADPVEAAAWGAGLWGRWLLLTEERFPGGPGTDCSAAPEGPAGPLERLARWRSRRLAARAVAAAEAGLDGKAAELFDRADALWPVDDAMVERRVALYARSAEALAARVLEEGDDPDLRLELAEDLLEAGDSTAALDVLEPVPRLVQAIDAGRLDWVAGTALLVGRASLGAGRAAEALEPLELAASLAPTEVEPRYFLGVCRLLAGDRPGARRAFVAACRMDGSLGRLRLRELAAAEAGPS